MKILKHYKNDTLNIMAEVVYLVDVDGLSITAINKMPKFNVYSSAGVNLKYKIGKNIISLGIKHANYLELNELLIALGYWTKLASEKHMTKPTLTNVDDILIQAAENMAKNKTITSADGSKGVVAEVILDTDMPKSSPEDRTEILNTTIFHTNNYYKVVGKIYYLYSRQNMSIAEIEKQLKFSETTIIQSIAVAENILREKETQPIIYKLIINEMAEYSRDEFYAKDSSKSLQDYRVPNNMGIFNISDIFAIENFIISVFPIEQLGVTSYRYVFAINDEHKKQVAIGQIMDDKFSVFNIESPDNVNLPNENPIYFIKITPESTNDELGVTVDFFNDNDRLEVLLKVVKFLNIITFKTYTPIGNEADNFNKLNQQLSDIVQQISEYEIELLNSILPTCCIMEVNIKDLFKLFDQVIGSALYADVINKNFSEKQLLQCGNLKRDMEKMQDDVTIMKNHLINMQGLVKINLYQTVIMNLMRELNRFTNKLAYILGPDIYEKI